MTDHLRPAGDDEAVAAYLLDELDDAAAAAFEARLAADARLAARLEALADALLDLRGADTAVPPPGFDQRLASRLAAARAAGPAAAAGGGDGAAGHFAGHAVAGVDGAGGDRAGDGEGRGGGARRAGGVARTGDGASRGSADESSGGPAAADDLARRRTARAARRWSTLGAVAAAVLGVALVGGTALRSVSVGGSAGGGASGGSAEQASRSSDELEAAAGAEQDSAGEVGEEQAPAAALPPQAGVTESAGGEAASGEATSAVGAVTLADTATPLRGAGDVRARFSDTPQLRSLRGAEPEVLAETAVGNAERVRRAPPFSSGAAPGDCLPTVLAGAGAAVTRVETVLWRGRSALVYILAGGTAGPASGEAVVVAVPGCAELARVPLDP